MDPVYGYERVNVEAEQRNQNSFLQWFRRLLDVRKQHPVLGHGSFEVLHPENAAIFAYVRKLGDDVILVVNNLSGRAQAAELDLHDYEGMFPVELLGRETFPRIGELPYLLTFGPHSFYWFQLVWNKDQ
jgi:maltose alpha-D-glucosyltransferase / alpha-amylase